MSLRIYCSDGIENIVNKLSFVKIVDVQDADITIDAGPIRGIPYLTIEDSSGQLSDTEVITLVTDMFKSMYPIEYGKYRLSLSSCEDIVNALKQIKHGQNVIYDIFFRKYNQEFLSVLRAKYIKDMLEATKKLYVDDESFKKFIYEYSNVVITDTDITVDGRGIWSPELFNSYIKEYLSVDYEECNTIYEKYLDEKNGSFLLRVIREYCTSMPADIFKLIIENLKQDE